MERTPLTRIAAWAGGRLEDAPPGAAASGVATDSRNVRPGDLFVALAGERFDGHAFVAQALSAGAAAALVGTAYRGRGPLVRVTDTLAGLGALAGGYRRSLPARVIGVTGSDGKTTTREIIVRALGGRYRVTGTSGNYNNQIGLPLTLLAVGREHEVCVAEMGMNHAGEIAALARIAAPDVGVVTTVGSAHRGFFRTAREIAAAKGELLEGLVGGRLAVVNRDTPYYELLARRAGGRVVGFGTRPGAACRGILRSVGEREFSFGVEGERAEFVMRFWNPAWMYAGLAGVAVAREFGVPGERVAEVLRGFAPIAGRGLIVDARGVSVVDESYNANPSSMRAALGALASKRGRRRVAVLGDMAELGRYEALYHRNLCRYTASLGLDGVATLGPAFRGAARAAGCRADSFNSMDELCDALGRTVRPGDLVLVKGSRIMAMERAVRFLTGQQ